MESSLSVSRLSPEYLVVLTVSPDKNIALHKSEYALPMPPPPRARRSVGLTKIQ